MAVDPEKLEWLLKVKRTKRTEPMRFEDPEKLMTDIEMLKVVLYLVYWTRRRRRRRRRRATVTDNYSSAPL